MCGRYALRTSVPDLARRLGVALAPELTETASRPRYNIAPTQPVAVIRADGARPVLAPMRWGLVPSWSKGPTSRYAMHNARIEGLAGKPAFRGPLRRRRCLVPADGWYEWQKVAARKQPWLLHRPEHEPFCFLGLWDEWEDDASALRSCTILTGAAHPSIAHVHDRMPLLAAPQAWQAWLDPEQTDPHAALALVDVDADPGVLATAVSSFVNDARHDEPRCAEPLL